MSLINDLKYLDIVSHNLSGFTPKSKYVWNMRCPICGDSKTNKRKMRGFIFLGKDKDSLVCGCHNCGMNMAFGNLLKELFPHVYTQYRLDGLTRNTIKPLQTAKKKEPNLVLHTKVKADEYVYSIESLPLSHVARQYLMMRKLDTNRFLYTPNFCNYVAEQTNNNEKYSKLPKDQRIIIPLYSPTGVLWGVQGRAIDPKAQRYITVKFDEDNYCKIFGLDRYNKDKAGFIVEGPFDSTFLPNSLAMCGSSLDMSAIDNGYIIPNNTVIVFDNEKRNAQIVAKMYKVIDSGFKIYIPPKELSGELKDINKMIMDGWDKKQIVGDLLSHTYFGIKAKLILNDWNRA